MAAKDAFDELIESEVRDARKPKAKLPEPPPGMVGTTSYRHNGTPQHRRAIRFAEPKGSAAALFFFWYGVLTIAAFSLTALAVAWYAEWPGGLLVAGLVAFAGLFQGMIFFAVVTALDRLDAAAHWSQQTAEAIRQAEENRH